MKQLVYLSKASPIFDVGELPALTSLSNKNNERAGITGCMVFASGYFLQLLEGEDFAVDQLYRKIQRDPRHTSTKILMNRDIDADKRVYTRWFMSSFNVDQVVEFPRALRDEIDAIVFDGTSGMPIQRLFLEFKRFLAEPTSGLRVTA